MVFLGVVSRRVIRQLESEVRGVSLPDVPTQGSTEA